MYNFLWKDRFHEVAMTLICMFSSSTSIVVFMIYIIYIYIFLNYLSWNFEQNFNKYELPPLSYACVDGRELQLVSLKSSIENNYTIFKVIRILEYTIYYTWVHK